MEPTNTTAQKPLSDFTAYLKSRKCSKCPSTYLLRSEKDASDLFKRWLTKKVPLSSWVQCKSCSRSCCIACNSESASKQSKIRAQGTEISWCCSRGRLFMIWALLCGFDEQFSAAKQRETTRSGTGRTTTDNGVGYASPALLREEARMVHKPLRNAKSQSVEHVTDQFNQLVFEFLGHLLPSVDRESKFDLDPPAAVNCMLLESSILSYCAELLRNDSLEDATKRQELYQALVRFLRTIGTHHYTAAPTVFQERPMRSSSGNLASLSWQDRVPKLEESTTSSLAENLSNLEVQSNLMLEEATKNEKEFRGKEGQNMLWLCRQVSDLSNYLLANRREKKHGSRSRETEGKELGDAGITEVPDKLMFSFHAHANQAQALNRSPPGRIKRLLTEITSLKTSLPPGIFVKYASSRPDLMKALIVGPSETPFENGLFEFDFFCSSQYPDIPPMCKFRGADGGRHIHPNLYADGKVCLSLLGTAPGEAWRPKESTILQVLISIQAMIFCEEPINTVPWRPSGPQQAQEMSASYNIFTQTLTARHAILDWIKNPRQMWQEIAKSHFQRNSDAILRTAEKWINMEATRANMGPAMRGGFQGFGGMRNVNERRGPDSVRNVLPELQRALKGYGATFRPNITTEASSPVVLPGSNRRYHGGKYDRMK